MSEKFFHSVYLDADLCKGCINCIKRCPTEAIRVRNGKACITSSFCIDCGECVRVCANHAKRVRRDNLDILKKYEYTVALPPPSLFGQFNNLYDIDILLSAFIYMGFDDVYEVSLAAELVSAASREYAAAHQEQWPLISTACPTVVRLIRVRFPNLVDHLIPINPPIEVAATLARKRAMAKTGLPADKIGIIFISPCPSKATYVKDPLGKDHSEVDGVLAVKDVYRDLLPHMKRAEKEPLHLARAGQAGISWGRSGGEANGLFTQSYLAGDGIENVIRVLEDLEDEKFGSLKFIELDACPGGCVGGALNVENPYVARTKLKFINKNLPENATQEEGALEKGELLWNKPVEYEPVFRLGENMMDNFTKLRQLDALLKELPGHDCGSCGAPTCRALAEDVVRGRAQKTDCIHILKDRIHSLSQEYNNHAKDAIINADDPNACIAILMNYVNNLTEEISKLDSNLTYRAKEEDNDSE